MSDEIIKLVQSLIDSKKGDADRLQQILNTLQGGGSLDEHDQNYLHEVSKPEPENISKQQPDDIPEQNPEEIATASETAGQENIEKLDSLEPAKTVDDLHEIPKDDDVEKTKNFSSRKKIAIVASAIAIIVVAYVVLDVYSVGTLQFRPHYGNSYQISPTEVHIQADVCNPSFFPVTFNRYEISAFYNSQPLEQAEIAGSLVSPKAMSTVDGVFTINATTIYVLKQENATFDPTLAKITTTVDAPIFGAIPFSVVKRYTSEQFQDILGSGPAGHFSCDLG